LVVGFLDILPILGPGALFVPWSLWEIASGNGSFGFELLVLYGIIVIVRQVLEPKIVADSIGLHPLATLVGMFVGLKAAGVMGMFLGPVILVLFQALRRAGLLPVYNGTNKR
jgi:predicted PurR-regulated permease PerM